MAQQSIALDGYPAPGATAVKIDWAGDHFGPSNYQASGYNLSAGSLGMSMIESAFVSQLAESQNYYAKIFYPANSGNNQSRAPAFFNLTVQWFYAANNTQVANNTNLSAEVVRLKATGI